jgi:hypothetical protein
VVRPPTPRIYDALFVERGHVEARLAPGQAQKFTRRFLDHVTDLILVSLFGFLVLGAGPVSQLPLTHVL